MGRKANLELLLFRLILIVSTASSAGYKEVQEFLFQFLNFVIFFLVKKALKTDTDMNDFYYDNVYTFIKYNIAVTLCGSSIPCCRFFGMENKCLMICMAK